MNTKRDSKAIEKVQLDAPALTCFEITNRCLPHADSVRKFRLGKALALSEISKIDRPQIALPSPSG